MSRTSRLLAGATIAALMLAPLVATAPAAAVTQAVLVASPAGSGSACSVTAPCSLTGARSAARALVPSMSGDIEVQLRGGTYALSSAFVLTDVDSGRNGNRVIYRAYPGETPVVSGGKPITGWTLADPALNIYSASVAPGFATRQLFVDGVRATRARGASNPGGFTYVPATGFTSSTAMGGWRNPGDIEIVDFTAWKSFRCGVGSIASDSITMDSACWANSQRQTGVKMDGVAWVENAYELLDQAGEWYLDRTLNKVYYIPRSGENLASAIVTASATESLLEVAGSIENPVRNLTISGLTFSYSTWLRPSTEEGYPSLQAGFLYTTGTEADPHAAKRDLLKTPAAVTITAGIDVQVERNVFTHLGSAALNLEEGTQGTTVRGNVFNDVSGAAIQVGHMNNSHPTTAENVLDNEISNNLIQDAALEYHDAVGIWVGYTEGTRVLHNEIARLPYTAISIGWGWGCVDPGGACGFSTPSASKDNEVAYNRIQDVMLTLVDGGAIYTLGAMPGTTIHDNFASGVRNKFGTLYFDEGSKSISMTGNVVASGYRWYHANASLNQNTLSGNWSNPDTGPVSSSPLAGNYTGLLTWPAEARAVINAAGLEPGYASIRPQGSVTGDLASGRTVSASSEYSWAHVAANAVDGQSATGWSPLAPTADPRPWLQVDLGARYQVTKVQLVTRQGGPDNPETRQDFEVQMSNDPAFATYVVLGGQGSTPLPHQDTWSQASAIAGAVGYQYVRAIKTTDAYFYINDLRVFGTTVRPPNVASGKPTSASSQISTSYAASYAVNGSETTGWSPLSPASDPRPWVQVDLGAQHQLARIEFVTRQDADQPATRQDFQLQVSNDPTFGTHTVLGSQGSVPLANASTWTLDVTDVAGYRYIRLAKSVDGYFFVAELRVFGVPSDTGNIAAGKATSASTVYDSISGHANVTDTLIATGWSPVAATTDPRPWIQVDLGGTFRLSSIEVVTRQSSPDQPVTRQDFEVRASNDPTFGTYTVLATQGSTPLAYRATLTEAVTDPMPFRYLRAIKTVDGYFYVSELRAYR